MPTPKTKAPTLDDINAAKGWNPEPGDTVEGTLVSIEEVDSNWGPYPMLTLQTKDGYVNVHAFHAVLLKKLTAIKPATGAQLRITFHGKRPNKKDPDKTYANYSVTDPNAAPAEPFAWGDKTDADF